jgi:hypothetical protein
VRGIRNFPRCQNPHCSCHPIPAQIFRHAGPRFIRRLVRHSLSLETTADVNGTEAFPVEVEVNSGWGDTVIVIIGLPHAAVNESRDRVFTALSNAGTTSRLIL